MEQALSLRQVQLDLWCGFEQMLAKDLLGLPLARARRALFRSQLLELQQ